MRCDFVNPLDEPQWNERILQGSGATFFHTTQWARVLVEAYGYQPRYAVFADAGRTIGILPIMEVQSVWTGRRGICLPFSDECAPLLANGVNLLDLIEPVRAFGLKHRWSYLELRGGGENLPGAVQSQEYAFHRLALDANEDVQFRKLKDSNRRNIQKSLRKGVQVERLYTRAAMDAFYSLHCQTRQHHGLPPQPASFFHLIHKIIIEQGQGFVSLARYQGRWIAGAVYFYFGSQAVYKFGASDRRFQHLRANNLLMWNAICFFRGEGFKELSLGRSHLHNSGLMQFKRSWGGEEVRMAYHQIGLCKKVRPVVPSQLASREALLQKVVQWIPVPILRLVGRLAYRHIA